MRRGGTRALLALCAGVAAAYETHQDQQDQPILQPSDDTTSRISHSGCKTPDPRGYLIYLAFGQQFNNQLISIAENMLLSRQLNRVLVLTGFLEQISAKKTSDGKDYFDSPRELKSFDQVFEKNASMEANGFHSYDVISMSDFMQLCPNQQSYPDMIAQAHVFVPDWEPDLWSKGYYLAYNTSYYLPQHMYECCHNSCCGPYSVPNTCSDCGQHGWNNRWDAGMGKHLPHFREVWQVAHGHDHVLQLSSMPSGLHVPVVIFDGLYYKFNATEPRYAPNSATVFEMIRHFQWAPAISSRARSYTDARFSEKPYVALHWRRGFSGGAIAIRNMTEVIHLLQEQLDLHRDNVTKAYPGMYIASNELTLQDMEWIRSKLPAGPQLASLLLEDSDDLDLNQLSRVEMAICQNALDFVPAPGSTWSMNVLALRGTKNAHFEEVGKLMDTKMTAARSAREEAMAKLAKSEMGGRHGHAQPAFY